MITQNWWGAGGGIRRRAAHWHWGFRSPAAPAAPGVKERRRDDHANPAGPQAPVALSRAGTAQGTAAAHASAAAGLAALADAHRDTDPAGPAVLAEPAARQFRDPVLVHHVPEQGGQRRGEVGHDRQRRWGDR